MKLMKTRLMLLLITGLSGAAAAAALGSSPDFASPMVVTNPTGGLRIQQGVPCNNDVDLTTPVTAGRIEISPSDGTDVPGGKAFVLARANVSFAPFSIHRSCATIDRTRNYTEVGVQLGQAVSFTAPASAPGVYAVTIPKDDFLIFEATIVNGESESGFQHPKEDVTGTIDLVHGTVNMRVVVGQTIHFKAGCTDTPFGEVCLIDQHKDGTLTATLSGDITFPDSDHDGVPDRSDNCRFVANPDQTPVPTPIVTPPPAITIASCADHNIGIASATDVCDGTHVTLTNNAPATFALASNVVLWRAEDAKGRSATANQNVTVVDTTPPIITSVPPDLTLNDCTAADLGSPTATDDCAGTPTFTNNAPAKFRLGTTVVTWTASDVSGNHATATQNVTVIDTVAPTVSCVRSSPVGGGFTVVSTDACSAPTIRLGTFVLANGEEIKIEETGRTGITLVNVVGEARTKHFQVGKGEAVITATDTSGNVASAACR
jgi:Thrombospondin type 3 repeat